MKKGFRILFMFIFLIFGTNFIFAASLLCKGPDGYYNDCDIVYKQSYDVNYYCDYRGYDYGELSYCRNSRGEYYYCYKQYKDYSSDNYCNEFYFQQYNDKYGNIIKISIPYSNKECCYFIDDKWTNSKKACNRIYDYHKGFYYPDYYTQLDLKNEEIKPVIIYVY